MAKIDFALLDIGYLDTLANGKTLVHRLDARAKLLATILFVVLVASHNRYDIAGLIPFFAFPAFLLIVGELPFGYLAKKLLIVAPFAVMIGIVNPFINTAPMLQIGEITISAGWVSFCSIILRFILTVSVALLLIATTSFPGVCMGLEKLGLPKALAVQLLLLYRYIFVLLDEGGRMVRGRALRSFGRSGEGLKVFVGLAGQLLVRTLERAQRIHLAMVCRGFDGEIRLIRRNRFGRSEMIFTACWIVYFLLVTCFDPVDTIGRLSMELLP